MPSFEGEISPIAYAIVAPAVVLSQHAAVFAVHSTRGEPLAADAIFWLAPFTALARMPGLSAWEAAAAFAFGLIAAWILAVLSFRRASHAGAGFALTPLAATPTLQVVAVAALALTRVRAPDAAADSEARRTAAAVTGGILSGVALIVFAVFVSALFFGAYGWGLFVLTPFLVGVTTAYLANRATPLRAGRTAALVLQAAALGCLSLILLAWEGLICVIIAAPLGALVAILGGLIGRLLARLRAGGSTPIMAVSTLPLVFALDAALPPSVMIESRDGIVISAPPADVWRALTTSDEIRPEAGFMFRLGLAYPVRARIVGAGVGGERRGEFSTGTARERITRWEPDRRLAFAVLSQPPVMAEFSPYEEVHAPHRQGYFETVSTEFSLQALPDGRTRLEVSAVHVLRLDPVPYWEPIARWAIAQNTARVLVHMRERAEAVPRRSPTG